MKPTYEIFKTIGLFFLCGPLLADIPPPDERERERERENQPKLERVNLEHCVESVPSEYYLVKITYGDRGADSVSKIADSCFKLSDNNREDFSSLFAMTKSEFDELGENGILNKMNEHSGFRLRSSPRQGISPEGPMDAPMEDAIEDLSAVRYVEATDKGVPKLIKINWTFVRVEDSGVMLQKTKEIEVW